MTAAQDAGEGGALGEITALELVLGHGTPAERAAARARMDADPAAMLEVADAVAFVEHWQELATEPSPAFPVRLGALVQRAERHLDPDGAARPAPRGWRGPLLGLAAGALVYAGLCWWDPFAARRAGEHCGELQLARHAAVVPEVAVEPEVPLVHELAWQADLASMRQRLVREDARHLQHALEAGLAAGADPLGRWLDPRNAQSLARLDHELRASAELRREALRRQGGIPAADARVQALADAVAEQLLAAITSGEPDCGAVALGARALIAAGPGGPARAAALHAVGGWLASRLPLLEIPSLARGLAAMVEIAALDGDRQALVAREGQRLVNSIVQVDGENWGRRLPELLGPRVAAGVVGDAGRVLARLPAYGVDTARCGVARELLVGALRERRADGEDSAELLAALLYGFDGSATAEERTQWELQLRRWKPARLAPDFATVQQMAWAIAPGMRGFTRMQYELRQVAVCPDPGELAARAALCLCLSTAYAAFDDGLLPRLAGGS